MIILLRKVVVTLFVISIVGGCANKTHWANSTPRYLDIPIEDRVVYRDLTKVYVRIPDHLALQLQHQINRSNQPLTKIPQVNYVFPAIDQSLVTLDIVNLISVKASDLNIENENLLALASEPTDLDIQTLVANDTTADNSENEELALESLEPGNEASDEIEEDPLLVLNTEPAGEGVCSTTLAIDEGALLSHITYQFLTTCGASLSKWVVDKHNKHVDYQFNQSADIDMPSGIDSLAFLLRDVYAINLIETSSSNYVVSLTVDKVLNANISNKLQE